MNARDAAMAETIRKSSLGTSEIVDAILAAGYTQVPVTAVQEQVNHMYAAAKQGENMFGENTASDHLRHFADKIGALLINEGDAA